MTLLVTLLDRAAYAREVADSHPGDSMYLLGRAHGLEEAHALVLRDRVDNAAS